MKLFLIEYQVVFTDGKQNMTIKDKMVVPAKSERAARSFFLETLEKTPVLLMAYNQTTRIMAPIRDLDGKVSVLHCAKL